jgi:two-component system, NtrC family, response regulator
MAQILIIDDEEQVCGVLSAFFLKQGHEPTSARTLSDGMRLAREGSFDVVFLDVHFPEGNGLDVLPRIMEVASSPEVIIMTGQAEPEGAETAIRSGAWDYIRKGASISDVALALVRALQYREKKNASELVASFSRDEIIGHSPQISMCLSLAAQAARHDTNVLLTGETGTGKELFARAIHYNSPRSERNLVVVDCTALPETLVEGMLFGHEKGAFTGAGSRYDGLVAQADGGTLLLDEVGELPMAIQKTFLRVLQERRYRPLGGSSEVASDFRLVATTNRDLEAMAAKGLFRNDLLFRLCSFPIHLPPLRERRGDIQSLALHLIARLSARLGCGSMGCSPEFLFALVDYDWPGNVRELVRALERAISSASDEGVLFRNHLPGGIRTHHARRLATEAPEASDVVEGGARPGADTPLGSLREARDAAVAESERRYLERLTEAVNGDIREACRVSGVSRSRLYALFQRHGLSFR